jgi:hypothetical protein
LVERMGLVAKSKAVGSLSESHGAGAEFRGIPLKANAGLRQVDHRDGFSVPRTHFEGEEFHLRIPAEDGEAPTKGIRETPSGIGIFGAGLAGDRGERAPRGITDFDPTATLVPEEAEVQLAGLLTHQHDVSKAGAMGEDEVLIPGLQHRTV